MVHHIEEKVGFPLVQLGAHLAGPEEFTQRAFLKGKMDLT
jgi:tRNA U34 5-carboxymethylaminomethyl modifying GTPase MnmE/TrmE